MTEATAILSPNRETQRMLRHRSAVMTLARMRAKKSVLLTLRAQGFKPQHFSVREIAMLTDYYLNQHRARLVAEAEEIIETWPGFASFRANVINSVQSKEPCSATTISVRNSSAEWRAD